MTVLEAIHQRHSIFPDIFIDKEVDDQDIEVLIQAANQAPAHKKTNPWRFKVVKGSALERLGTFMSGLYKENVTPEKFSQFKHDKILKRTLQSGAVIAICMQRDPMERVPEWEEVAATAMAVQNLWLSATELGLGGYWSSPGLINKMDDFFNLAHGERCLGFFYLGHYDHNKYAEVVHKPKLVAATSWMRD